MLCIVFLLIECGAPSGESSVSKLLAEVEGEQLYLSELEGMIPPGSTSEDSALIVNAFVERWVREAVLLNEAERNVPKDFNIDQLVRDYRASLVKNNYENILIDQLMDSTVTKEEIGNFYESNREYFRLNEPIIRYWLLQVPENHPEIDDLKKWWQQISKEENQEKVLEFATRNRIDAKLKDSTWYEVSELIEELPTGWMSKTNVKTTTNFIRKDEGVEYFFRPFKVIQKDATPPQAYLKAKIKRAILHQRKQKFLEEKKEEMYTRELRQQKIKIYD